MHDDVLHIRPIVAYHGYGVLVAGTQKVPALLSLQPDRGDTLRNHSNK